ncbi:MAG: hypothetical protein ACJAQS_001210 [Porticoccus sp.]|jgi:hypothetical protein
MTLSKNINFTIVIVFTLLVASFARADAASWEAWDKILQATVTDNGFVDYDAIAATGQIDSIVEVIAKTDPQSLNSTTELLVFYINSYNALVIKTILTGKSPSNVFSRIGFFKGPQYNVAGQNVNLSDLEHKIIRPLNEPRIHFALVCAALSCPKLLNTIYTAPDLEQQFDTVTRQFINNTDRNHFDRAENTAYLSKIFQWFSEDFELDGSSVASFVADHIDDKSLATELRKGDYEIEHNKYFWDLNGKFNN